PYQRKDWDKPYPADQLAQLKDLVQAAKKNNIRFVYSISPGIPAPLPDETITAERAEESITFSSTNDRAKLLAKLDQLRSIGIN
ncbi:protein O-GlcNAcase, partial [Frankia sp. Cpl3]|nr:protein O-GlcNAcase [Frankia sp. Cpl3]